VHHVRDDVADPLPWDLAFLTISALLIVVGIAVAWRRGEASAPAD
jgi:uncharacterized membrane protein